VEWYANWEDCVNACHSRLPTATRLSLIERLKTHAARSRYLRPILAAKSSGGSSAYIVLHEGALATIGGLGFPDCDSSTCRADTAMLLEDLIEYAALDTEIVQAVMTHGELSPAEKLAYEECFRSAGLGRVAELVQIEWIAPESENRSKLDLAIHRRDDGSLEIADGVTLLDANQLEFDEFAEIVEATYTDTLDVPELNGIRSTHNTIEGYAACVPEGHLPWWVVKMNGRVAGCLLLCPHQQELVELVYLGLIPEARGHGIGLSILSFVQYWALDRGSSRIVAAVDSRNRPALQLYEKMGYQEFSRADAWIKAS
jgi:GNAT superfamily N-acetyltransferase